MSTAVQAQFMRALALHQQGKLREAGVIYEAIIAKFPLHADSFHQLGLVLCQMGELEKSCEFIKRAAILKPENYIFKFSLANVLHALKKFQEALICFDQVIAFYPNMAEALNNKGNLLLEIGELDQALLSFERAIDIKKTLPEAHYGRSLVLARLGKSGKALTSLDEAIKCRKKYVEAHFQKGSIQINEGLYESAIQSFSNVLVINSKIAPAHFMIGNAFFALKRFSEAVSSYQKAVGIEGRYAEAWNNCGTALRAQGLNVEAIDCFVKALSINPNYIDALINTANLYAESKQYDHAIVYFEKALNLGRDRHYIFGSYLHTKMLACNWEGFDQNVSDLVKEPSAGKKYVSPFPLLSICDFPTLHLDSAVAWCLDEYPYNASLGVMPEHAVKEKIRLGYYSADFRQHPVSVLLAGVLESHDREKFELFAFSSGPDTNDPLRQRIKAAFDHFIDIAASTDQEVAALSRQLGIDIAIDLGGHTQDSRFGVFAYRAAPIQVSYLGYPGTTGAEYMDYLIADSILVSEEDHCHYSEKIVTLPSYQPNDNSQVISDRRFTRAEQGLPDEGFVYCCFNDAYKITPPVFDSWMRILKAVPNSVLWLRNSSQLGMDRLRQEASTRGVEPSRLIFADRMPTIAEHLARLKLADLFLDTLPYNAHATASDALWAGLPLLTLKGKAFASRVGASVLTAIGLPELITETKAQYESLAIELATHPEQLDAIKAKLERNRLTQPLFDTKQYTKNLETAYNQMMSRLQDNLKPDQLNACHSNF